MSLTSELKKPNSALSLYFKNNFNFKPFLNEENKGIFGSYTIRPKSFDNYPWSEMGRITEYLLALQIGFPMYQLLPMKIANNNYPVIYNEINKKYSKFIAKLNNIDFQEITTDLYKLSQIETVYRNGIIVDSKTINNSNASTYMIEDLKTIYKLSLSQHELFNDKKNKFIYNPKFDLSTSIGGADADLYLIRKKGNYLLDLKTTIKPVVQEDMMQQLLGYVFLDKSNVHNFTEIGLYLPRQNLISEWNIKELVKDLSSFASVEEAKESFIQIVESNVTKTIKRVI